jgi:hypothetical protein
MTSLNLNSCKRNAVSFAQRLECIDGHRKQHRSAKSLKLLDRRQVRFQAEKSAVSALVCVDQNLGNMPVTFAGRNHFSTLHHRILNVDVNGVRFEQRPIVKRIFVLLDEIGEVKNSPEFWRIDRLH